MDDLLSTPLARRVEECEFSLSPKMSLIFALRKPYVVSREHGIKNNSTESKLLLSSNFFRQETSLDKQTVCAPFYHNFLSFPLNLVKFSDMTCRWNFLKFIGRHY